MWGVISKIKRVLYVTYCQSAEILLPIVRVGLMLWCAVSVAKCAREWCVLKCVTYFKSFHEYNRIRVNT